MTGEEKNQILKAFTESGYTVRSASGLKRDASLPPLRFQVALSEAIAGGLVSQKTGKDGSPKFFLTEQGRVEVAKLYQSGSVTKHD